MKLSLVVPFLLALPGVAQSTVAVAKTAPGLPQSSPGVGAAVVVTEVETNDTIAYADDLAAQFDYDGDIPIAGDSDVVKLVLAADALLSIGVNASGANPITDPELLVTNSHGVLFTYDDDQASSTYPLIVREFPAGTYYLHVAGVAGSTGTYRLSMQSAAGSIPSVTLNQVVNAMLPGGSEQAYRFTLPADGSVTISGTAPGLDLYMTLHNALGGEVDTFDDRTLSNPDPLVMTRLPAGQYTLFVGEYNDSAGAFSMQVQHTAGTIPPATCGVTANGNMQGQTTLDMYRLAVAVPSTITLTTAAGSGQATSDTSLRIYDRNMEELFYNDDEGGGAQPYARLSMPLPVGTYYAAVGGFRSVTPGNYRLTTACVSTFTPMPAAYGSNAGNIVTGPKTDLFGLAVGTPVPVQMRVDASTGTLADGEIAVLDTSGALVAVSSDSGGLLDGHAGALLPVGTYWILVRDYENGLGSYDLRVTSLHWFTDVIGNHTLNYTDKAGRFCLTLAAVNLLPGPVPMPPPIIGNLLIDLTLYIDLGSTVIPPSGSTQSPINFNPYPVKLQGLALTLVPLSDLRMTDVVQ